MPIITTPPAAKMNAVIIRATSAPSVPTSVPAIAGPAIVTAV
jgi:hypothetical protein